MTYTVRRLEPSAWDVFAELVERNNGVYGGCWCIAFHPECGQPGIDYREAKAVRVRTGRAHHAALVVDDHGAAQGWCQYGDPDELSGIKHRRKYDQAEPIPPDWRITCIFVDKRHRGKGIARIALEGALHHLAELGGGHVEAISETTTGRQAHSRFLFSATAELFEQYGFERTHQVGKHAWILTKTILPSRNTTRDG